ncbi:DUF1453 domain-containing protein [Streptantibioticus rubrisoli]|uniref:DUF1453 domain-containing protein n=1 Tax=Streptantibioticus rubrisoli TaxID=1387313 RepID=A0ABT1PCJ2_9ACTN|nr:DUF1453 domain-containing protein [Streptantibioticus rubrisoli]MCQ4043071.1 DUF1453 domain-containing protein [Streptantibioticus rubrisoli]
MSTWLVVTLIAVVAVIVVVKRLIGEPLNVRDLFVPPIALIGVGVWLLCETDGLTRADIAWATAGAALGLALGAVRGMTIRVFDKGGVLWQRYTGRTFLVVVASLAASAGFGLFATAMGMHEGARPVQLSIGVGFLGEALVVGRRALATGIPFAPETRRRW